MQDSELPGFPLQAKTPFTLPVECSDGAVTSTWQAPSDIQDHIQHLLTTRITPALLQTYSEKLELLRRCSFYIEVTQVDWPRDDHTYASNSAAMQLIDSSMFQRMKNIGNSQVKIQLALLEELLGELSRGCAELQAASGQRGLGEYPVQEKISRLLQAAAEFEEVLVPSRLHLKHQLIFGFSSTNIPDIRLALSIKTPVRFDKTRCAASSDSVVLRWSIDGNEQHELGEQFEIGYKLLNPTNEAEGNQTARLACGGYCLRIDSLMPDRSYEFTIKRVDSWSLVYSLWMDGVLLRTGSGPVE
ncbi:hypothetical protein NFI96_003498 [Prochilodus magdalenae]|nr:hypothetical protein NFI96_003498 [Prochilodus magdalenae]